MMSLLSISRFPAEASSRRRCVPCKISAARLLGDGTFGSLDRAKVDRYYRNLEKRRAARGKSYDLIDGVLTRGLLERFADIRAGRVCFECLVPLGPKAGPSVALQSV